LCQRIHTVTILHISSLDIENLSFSLFSTYARTSAYLAYDPESTNLPKHIYFQSTPDHVLSVDYSPWLDAILLCDSNGIPNEFENERQYLILSRSCLFFSCDEFRTMDKKK